MTPLSFLPKKENDKKRNKEHDYSSDSCRSLCFEILDSSSRELNRR